MMKEIIGKKVHVAIKNMHSGGIIGYLLNGGGIGINGWVLPRNEHKKNAVRAVQSLLACVSGEER